MASLLSRASRTELPDTRERIKQELAESAEDESTAWGNDRSPYFRIHLCDLLFKNFCPRSDVNKR